MRESEEPLLSKPGEGTGIGLKSVIRLACRSVLPQLAFATLFFGVGVALAAVAHALLYEPEGRSYLDSLFTKNVLLHWTIGHKGYWTTVFSFLAVALIVRGASRLKRLASSWISGTLTALPLLSLCSAAFVFAPDNEPFFYRIVASLTIIALGCLLSYIFRLVARLAIVRWNSRRVRPAGALQMVRPDAAELDSDEPVTTWEGDLLDRGPLVEVLATKVLALKKPVVILNGRFGSGKSSVLNLLRLRLENQAVVVSFSAWLPGSESTLTDFLISDIVAECGKRFVIPGLAKSARRFASALSKSVPYLSGLTELLPSVTQRDAVSDLRASLLKVPLRVVVLIDEVDRMQKSEIFELLKLLRGFGGMPNLSFICACDREQVINAIRPPDDKQGDETREYFEKFFLDVLPLSEPAADRLQALGIGRILRTLEYCNVFKTDLEKQVFRTALTDLWPRCFAPYCCNLRRVGIISNDFQGVATLLGRDANPIDAALITLLHRMSPGIHRLVATQQLILTGGSGGFKHQRYFGDSDKSRREKELGAKINELCSSDEEREVVHRVLTELFPLFPKLLGRNSTFVSQDELGGSLRITYPSMFDAYFRLEVPRDVFRASELERFRELIAPAKSIEQVTQIFGETLEAIEPGSDRAEDFLWKISLSVSFLDENVARWLALSVMRFADKYIYDRDARLWRDSLYAFRVVREALRRIPDSDRANFLRACIGEAADDTMAHGLIAGLTDLRGPQTQEDNVLRVPLKAVCDTFVARMRSKYKDGVDVSTDEVIRTSDPEAFALWGSIDLSKWGITVRPSDKEMRDDFWARYIGVSKHRLARIFDGFFMPMGMYEGDPSPFVERRISLAVLRKLAADLTYAPDLTKEEAGSLRRIDSLLRGDYKDGVPLTEWQTL